MTDILTWILVLLNFLLGNFFLLILLLGELLFVFYKARDGGYQWYRDAAGSVAITVLILHGGWSQSEVAYWPFVLNMLVPLIIACIVAAIVGMVFRKRSR